MERRLSYSMPSFLPLSYVSKRELAFMGRGRSMNRLVYINGVGPTRLVGSSPARRPPQRLILCTPHGTYEKVTRSSSVVELSRSGVYRSREDLRDARAERRAASCEDMYRGSQTFWDSSRFSESGVSVNCSHTDEGSFVGADEDAVSQSSFGSSSAFCEITCDSELDRPDSDCVSVPGSLGGHERVLDVLHEDYARERRADKASTHHRYSKHKEDRASSFHNDRESDASSVKSGEFLHSTPTKKGSLSLSLFHFDDADLQISKDSPTSPRKTKDKQKTDQSAESSSNNRGSLRETVNKRREEFFSSLHDNTKLDDLSAGDSIQAWVSTGHRRTGVSNWINDLPSSLQRQLHRQQNQQPSQPPPSSLPLPTGARESVRERVKALENQGRGAGRSDDAVCTKGTDAGRSAALAEPQEGRVDLFSSRQLRQPAPQTASQIGPPQRGGGGYEIGNFGSETHSTSTTVSGKVSPGEESQHRGREVSTTASTTSDVEITDRFGRISGGSEEVSSVISHDNEGLTSVDGQSAAGGGVKLSASAPTDQTIGDAVDGSYNSESGGHATVSRPALLTADAQTTTRATCGDEGALSGRGQLATGRELSEERSNQQLVHTDVKGTAPSSPPHDRDKTSCHSASPSTFPPPYSCSTDLEFRHQVVAPPKAGPALSVNMSSRQNHDSLPHGRSQNGAWREPEACFVDRSEEYEPEVKIREIRRTHTRHIHRTIVQQIVTTHRALRHDRENTPHSSADSYVNCDANRCAALSNGDSDIVTDRTVSTLLKEDTCDSTEETRCLTHQHLAHFSYTPGGEHRGQSLASLPSHGSAVPVVHAATAQRQLSERQEQQQYSSTVTATTADTGQVTMNASPAANQSLLDRLQEQLSRLSSDDATLSSSLGTGREARQVWGYRDHAEATVPHTAQSGTVSSQGEIDSKTRVCGTGSVFITLDKSGLDTSAHTQSSALRDSFSSDKGELKDKVERSTSPSHQGGKVTWRRPASTSSELDESDGNYSSISTTESSQYPVAHTSLSESDFPPSEGPEDYDNVHSFHDFVSGLQGQSTSNQPSALHSPDVLTATDFRHSLLRSPVIQETILEADDESESADEASTTLGSFKTSLHFTVSEAQCQSTPTHPPASHVPQIKLWSSDQRVTTLSPSGGDIINTLSPVDPLQDLSDRLASLSTVHDISDGMSTLSDTSYEVEHHMSHHLNELDTSLTPMSSCGSPAPSDVSEGSVYSSIGFAEIRKPIESSSSRTRAKSSETKSHQVRRKLESTFTSLKQPDWVLEKQVLFEKLLADLEAQSRPQVKVMFDEMCAFETQQRDGVADVQTDACDDLYKAFTHEDLEKRQNHVCPIIDDQMMPVFRFKRFLKKNHSSKMKGMGRFKILNKLDRLSESPSQSPSEMDFAKLRQKPYERSLKLTSHSMTSDSRLPSDVFIEDDVKRSFSDSAYSTLSSVSSRHCSDLDSMMSVSSSRGDLSSTAADHSMESDKMTALSEVFEQLDVCEGEIDQALLDRLRVGHHSYVPTRHSHHN